MEEEKKELITENTEDLSAGTSNEKGSKKGVLKGRNVQRAVAGMLMVGMLAVGLIVAGLKIFALRPYAVELDGKNVCYIRNREDISKVLDLLVEDYMPDKARLKAVNVDDSIRVEQADHIIMDDNKVLSPEDAAAEIRGMLKGLQDNDKVRITTVSTRTEVGKYTPEIKYEKDDSMLAGEAEVLEEGKDGKEERLMSYTCVNGEVTDKETLETTILEEGESKVVKKGTLGLPEGEDWRTYEGDPVYKNGSEVADTGLNYLGAPYKYGGNSLTNGIDCVQFVRQMYKKYGIKLPNSHKGLQRVGIGVPLSKAQRGDIVCYSKHVAIYLGDGKIVEAVPKHGVRVGKVNRKRLITIRRVVGE